MGEIVPVGSSDLALIDATGLAALEAAELAAVRDLARKSVADSTRAAYAKDMQAFADWCAPRGLDPLPADVTTVRRWLGSESERLAVASTLRQLVEPLTDWPADVRDRAILTIGMLGALRRSEIVAIDVEHMTVDEDGLRLRILRSKRDQEGAGALVGMPNGVRWETCPATSWETWLEASEIEHGPAFRAVDRHGNISPTRLTDRQIARIVQRRAEAVGLPGAEFAGHSLRAGFATEAVSRGRSELAVMRHGRWRSGQAMRGYVQEGGLWKDNAAKGLGL